MNTFKDDYDGFLEFNRITPENWLLPDRKNYLPLGVMQDEWLAPFLVPSLTANVPRDVIRMFEVARAAMIYSWFFYPLATLGLEQCTRIVDFATCERCKLLKRKPGKFVNNLKILVKAGIIKTDDEQRWQSVRQLRNIRSHIKTFMLMDPGLAIESLQSMADLINALFATPTKN